MSQMRYHQLAWDTVRSSEASQSIFDVTALENIADIRATNCKASLPNDGFQQPPPSNPRQQERISHGLIYFKDIESPLNLRFVWIVEADEGRPFQMWWRQIVVPLFYE